MSDGRNVPPTLGTEPRVGGSRGERRHREEPGIYAQYHGRGSHAYTLDEIDARIMACAADEAATPGNGPLRPPLFRELEGIFWHRLFRDLPRGREAMASYGSERALATARQEAAQENAQRFERQRRELASRQMLMRRPVTGLTLSRPWFLLVCLAPAALIEIIGSTPSVQEAFKLDVGWAILFAVGISLVLVLTAEQLGNALSAATAHSRRLTTAAAGFLLLLAIGAGIVAIVSLAESRETNLSFREAVEASRTTTDESGRIGGAAESGSPSAPASEAGSSGAVVADAPTKPDFEFFVPLSILVLAASTLAAFRVEAAREHNQLADEVKRVAATAEGQRGVGEEEVDAEVESAEAENAVLQDLAAYVEQERNLLGIWIARFEVEYGRFCAVAGKAPRPLQAPALPNAGDVLLQILRPQRGWRPVPEDGAIRDLAGGENGGGGNDHPGPEADGTDQDRGPGPGGPDTPTPPTEQEPPPPPPPPEPELRGPPPRTSFDDEGRPAGGRWMDGYRSQGPEED